MAAPNEEPCPTYTETVDADKTKLYSLIQPDPRTITITAIDQLTECSKHEYYRITTSQSSAIMSLKKKHNILLSRVDTNGQEHKLAMANFSNTKTQPIVPSAGVSFENKQAPAILMVSSQNYRNWDFTLSGNKMAWVLTAKPVTAVLVRNESKPDQAILARFLFSGRGTLADNGEGVGELAVEDLRAIGTAVDLETVFLTLNVLIENLRRLQKHTKNDQDFPLPKQKWYANIGLGMGGAPIT